MIHLSDDEEFFEGCLHTNTLLENNAEIVQRSQETDRISHELCHILRVPSMAEAIKKVKTELDKFESLTLEIAHLKTQLDEMDANEKV